MAPRVELQVVDPPPVLAPAAPSRTLQGDAPERPAPPGGARGHHLGVTTARILLNKGIEVRWQETAGGVCARPARVALVLEQAEHRIRLARELPPDGCLWREVEAHERRHAAANQAGLRRGAAEIRQAAEAWAARAEGRGMSLEAAVGSLQAGLQAVVAPRVEAMRRAFAAANAAIDSPEEYARLSRICPEDQAVLRSRLPP